MNGVGTSEGENSKETLAIPANDQGCAKEIHNPKAFHYMSSEI